MQGWNTWVKGAEVQLHRSSHCSFNTCPSNLVPRISEVSFLSPSWLPLPFSSIVRTVYYSSLSASAPVPLNPPQNASKSDHITPICLKSPLRGPTAHKAKVNTLGQPLALLWSGHRIPPDSWLIPSPSLCSRYASFLIIMHQLSPLSMLSMVSAFVSSLTSCHFPLCILCSKPYWALPIPPVHYAYMTRPSQGERELNPRPQSDYTTWTVTTRWPYPQAQIIRTSVVLYEWRFPGGVTNSEDQWPRYLNGERKDSSSLTASAEAHINEENHIRSLQKIAF